MSASPRSDHLIASSLLLVTVALLAQPWLTSLVASSSQRVVVTNQSAPDQTMAEGVDGTDGEKENTKKLYEVKREHYSIMMGNWASQEEEGSEDEKGLLFTVRHRTWPKSSDFAGHRDYTAVSIMAQPLIDVLRLQLSEVEQVFDDEPSINADDLFLHLPDLRVLLDKRKEDVDRLKKQEDIEADAGRKQLDDAPESIKQEVAQELGGVAKPAKEEGDDELVLVASETKTSNEIAVQCQQLSALLSYLDELFAPIKSKLERFKVEGVISFQLLWTLFPVGQIVEMTDEISGERMAFKLKNTNYSMMRDGLAFRLTGIKIVWTGSRYANAWVDATIPKFKALRKISSLPASPISDAHRVELSARGRLYRDLARVAFLEYSGSLIQVVGSGADRRILKRRAEGRAVVDAKSYQRMNPGQETEWEDDDEEGMEMGWIGAAEPILEEELCIYPPTVFGFSLVQREWGQLRVDQFTDVIFNASAYDSLVLEPDQKDLIRSLVQQNTLAAKARSEIQFDENGRVVPPPLQDFIAGKGGGLVIACHGRPGVGKTLTAEAVAELLRVPLYSCGAGELGTSPDVLEQRLRDILDVASTWGAVMLIDESEVFLSTRNAHDVNRNALVSVFLRLLEYHSGVLILTTNRIRDIDPAFTSRFSLALTYPDLDAAKRRTIWTSFLKLSGAIIGDEPNGRAAHGLATPEASGASSPTSAISPSLLDKLAKKPMNGRSIKNICRTAHALANSKGVPLAAEHIFTVVKVSEEFAEALKEMDEEGVYDVKGEGWKDRQNVYI